MKQVLITGAGSYVGTSLEAWLKQNCFNALYHTDISKIPWEKKKMYYKINCGLAVETARKVRIQRRVPHEYLDY